MAFRLSPWLLVGSVVAAAGAVVAIVRRVLWSTRSSLPVSVLAVLLLAPVPYLVVITLAGQKYDRYALPLFPFLALLVGVGLSLVLRHVPARVRTARSLVPAGLVVTALLAIATLVQAPYAISYADPLVGGRSRPAEASSSDGEKAWRPSAPRRSANSKASAAHNARILGAPFYVVAFPVHTTRLSCRGRRQEQRRLLRALREPVTAVESGLQGL